MQNARMCRWRLNLRECPGLLAALALALATGLLARPASAQTPPPEQPPSTPESRAPGARAAYSAFRPLELRSPVARANVDVEVPSTRAIYD